MIRIGQGIDIHPFDDSRPLILGGSSEIGAETREVGGIFARLQTGLLRTYALAIASSIAVLAIVFVAVK